MAQPFPVAVCAEMTWRDKPIPWRGARLGEMGFAVRAHVPAIARPQLHVNLYLYHTPIGEGDLIRWCEKCLPWMEAMQVADNPEHFEPRTNEINYALVAEGVGR